MGTVVIARETMSEYVERRDRPSWVSTNAVRIYLGLLDLDTIIGDILMKARNGIRCGLEQSFNRSGIVIPDLPNVRPLVRGVAGFRRHDYKTVAIRCGQMRLWHTSSLSLAFSCGITAHFHYAVQRCASYRLAIEEIISWSVVSSQALANRARSVASVPILPTSRATVAATGPCSHLTLPTSFCGVKGNFSRSSPSGMRHGITTPRSWKKEPIIDNMVLCWSLLW